jgi:transposase
MLGGDPGHQRLCTVPARHAEQVRAVGHRLPGQAATSTVPGPSSSATSAPSASARSFRPNLPTFPPPDRGFMIKNACWGGGTSRLGIPASPAPAASARRPAPAASTISATATRATHNRPLLWNLHRTCRRIRRIRLIWADAVYAGKLSAWAASLKMTVCIVARRDPHAFEVLPRRWVVERTFAWISKHRRTTRDYERLPTSHEAMAMWVMIILMARRLARP